MNRRDLSFRSTLFTSLLFGVCVVTPAVEAQGVRTVLVSPVPGNPTASGTALRNAVQQVAAAGPSSSNRWLIRLEPGTYGLGSNALVLPSWTDVEGSGQSQILGTVSSSFPRIVVQVGSHSELRDLTITAQGTGSGEAVALGVLLRRNVKLTNLVVLASGSSSSNEAVRIQSGEDIELRQVSATAVGGISASALTVTRASTALERHRLSGCSFEASGASYRNRAVLLDLSFGGSASSPALSLLDTQIVAKGGQWTQGLEVALPGVGSVHLEAVQARLRATQGSLLNQGAVFTSGSGQLELQGSRVEAEGSRSVAVQFDAAARVTARLDSSVVRGGLGTVLSQGLSGIRIGGSRLEGGPVSSTGTAPICAVNYDENYAFFAATCP